MPAATAALAPLLVCEGKDATRHLMRQTNRSQVAFLITSLRGKADTPCACARVGMWRDLPCARKKPFANRCLWQHLHSLPVGDNFGNSSVPVAYRARSLRESGGMQSKLMLRCPYHLNWPFTLSFVLRGTRAPNPKMWCYLDLSLRTVAITPASRPLPGTNHNI